MAIVLPKFPRGDLPSVATLKDTCPILMRISSLRPAYRPGQPLVCDISLHSWALTQTTAIELSIVWFTEGKGNEDMMVHYFRRLAGSQIEPVLHERLVQIQTEMPAGPLSYDGRIVRLKWAVRVRLFLASGEESLLDRPFSLLPAVQR